MSRLRTPQGFVRLTDGAFLVRARPITPPAVTKVGQAVLVGSEYVQTVAIPQPPEGWRWYFWTFGRRVQRVFAGSTVEVYAGEPGVPGRPLIFFLAGDGETVPAHWRSRQISILGDLPAIQPLGIVGAASLTTAGSVGSTFSLAWPSVASGTPTSGPTRAIRLYVDAGTLDVDETIADPSDGEIPAEWLGRFADAYWTVGDPALGLRAFASQRIEITPAVATAAPTLADLPLLRAEYRPAGQSITFSPIFGSPPTKAIPPWEFRWRTGPLSDTAAPYFDLEPNPGQPGEWRLADAFGVPTVNSALYRAGEARNQQLRFNVRPGPGLPWSGDGPVYSVPAPAIVTNPPPPDDENPRPLPYPAPWRTIPESTAASALANESANAIEMQNAIVAAPAGAHIAVRNGARVGEMTFPNDVTKSSAVTIRPVLWNGPEVIFRSMYFRNGSSGRRATGLTFRDITFRGNRSFRNEGVYPSRPSTQGDTSGGRPTGLWLANCARIEFYDCQFAFFDVLVECSNMTDTKFIRCEMTEWGNDLIRAYNRIARVQMLNCWAHDRAVDEYQATEGPYENERHPDWFQMSNSTTGAGGEDVLIAFCMMEELDGGYQQIFYLNSERGNSYQFGDPLFPGAAHRGIRVINCYTASAHTGAVVAGGLATLTFPDGRAPIESVIRSNVHRAVETYASQQARAADRAAGRPERAPVLGRPGISVKGDNVCRITNNVNSVRSGSDILTGGIRAERSRPRGSDVAPIGRLGVAGANNVQHSGNVMSRTAFPPDWQAFRAGRAGRGDRAAPTAA